MINLNIIETKVLLKESGSAGTKSRIFVFPKDSNTCNKCDATGFAAYTVYRKTDVVKAGLKALGLPENAKVSWSRTAGCSCGCSPGFVVKDHYLPKDAFLTVQA